MAQSNGRYTDLGDDSSAIVSLKRLHAWPWYIGTYCKQKTFLNLFPLNAASACVYFAFEDSSSFAACWENIHLFAMSLKLRSSLKSSLSHLSNAYDDWWGFLSFWPCSVLYGSGCSLDVDSGHVWALMMLCWRLEPNDVGYSWFVALPSLLSWLPVLWRRSMSGVLLPVLQSDIISMNSSFNSATRGIFGCLVSLFSTAKIFNMK